MRTLFYEQNMNAPNSCEIIDPCVATGHEDDKQTDLLLQLYQGFHTHNVLCSPSLRAFQYLQHQVHGYKFLRFVPGNTTTITTVLVRNNKVEASPISIRVLASLPSH